MRSPASHDPTSTNEQWEVEHIASVRGSHYIRKGFPYNFITVGGVTG